MGPVPTVVDSAIAYSAGAGVYGPACHMGRGRGKF